MTAALQFWLDPAARAAGALFEAPRAGDAGYDLRAARQVLLPAGAQAVVGTGLRLAIPPGWVGIVKDRSSMAVKRVYTHAGVIDSAYRGEVKVVLSNHSAEAFEIKPGSKIAQLVLLPHLAGAKEVGRAEELGATVRGPAGFGSTGG